MLHLACRINGRSKKKRDTSRAMEDVGGRFQEERCYGKMDRLCLGLMCDLSTQK